MANKKFPLVRGRAMRVTRLDGCGQVALGPKSQVATDGFISIGLTANNEEGETISVTNAAGDVCILDEPAPKFTNFTVEVAFCGVDPELFTMMTGQPLVMSADGADAVGFRINSKVKAEDSGFALESWSSVPVAACDASGESSYGYFLLPFVQGGTLGDVTIENGAINFTLSGASTKDGSEWGVGPYNVVRDETGVASPLDEPIDPDGDHFHLELTTVAPPSPSAGAIPVGVPATGGTAGTPGSLTPANSYATDLADLSDVTASPNTAWTTGQYINLADGTTANWNGTAWEAGPA